MTLVVSLRIPDGLIIATDSLQTTSRKIVPGIKDLKIKHKKTGEEIPIGDLNFPPITIPTSTFSFAQKLFPFKKKFGIATFGSAILNGRTIYNHIKNLENNNPDEINSAESASNLIMDYFSKQLDEELKRTKQQLPPNTIVLGFQVVGYESTEDLIGHTIEVQIGSNTKLEVIDGIGCTVSGDTAVVSTLWKLDEDQRNQINYGSFSLKDACDYAEFLINTTSSHQRFANMIPTVGGAVDIALITNYSEFKWIKFKELTRILENIT